MEKMPNHSTQGEYDRPVLVVDVKPVKDADLLVNECEAFILTLRNQNHVVESTRFPTLQHFRHSWMAKTNVTQNVAHYENFRIKIRDTEKVLRGMLVSIIDKKSILKTQARYLITRLNSCLDYQSRLLSDADNPVSELREIIDDLANESSHIKIMVVFNNEVIRQKNVQTVRQGKTYIPWTKKRNANIVSEEDLSKDDDYPVLHHRLHDLRTFRERVVAYLSELLEKKESISLAMDSYLSIRLSLQSFLKNDQSSTDYNSTQDEENDSKVEMIQFDHSRCKDCTHSKDLAVDCIEHLTSLENHALEASKCLRVLVETREKMRDSFELMEQGQNLSHGHESTPHNAIQTTSRQHVNQHSSGQLDSDSHGSYSNANSKKADLSPRGFKQISDNRNHTALKQVLNSNTTQTSVKHTTGSTLRDNRVAVDANDPDYSNSLLAGRNSYTQGGNAGIVPHSNKLGEDQAHSLSSSFSSFATQSSQVGASANISLYHNHHLTIAEVSKGDKIDSIANTNNEILTVPTIISKASSTDSSAAPTSAAYNNSKGSHKITSQMTASLHQLLSAGTATSDPSVNTSSSAVANNSSNNADISELLSTSLTENNLQAHVNMLTGKSIPDDANSIASGSTKSKSRSRSQSRDSSSSSSSSTSKKDGTKLNSVSVTSSANATNLSNNNENMLQLIAKQLGQTFLSNSPSPPPSPPNGFVDGDKHAPSHAMAQALLHKTASHAVEPENNNSIELKPNNHVTAANNTKL